MTQKKQTSQTSTALRKENADLKLQVAHLQSQLHTSKKQAASSPQPQRHPFGWRKPVMWFSLALATALLVTGNLVFWAGNTLVDTNRYVAAVGPLIQKPEIQSAIASYTTTQIFNNVDVNSYVTSVLPPKAAFLAPQLTSQLRDYTQKTIQSTLQNPKVQSYWYSSLTKRHNAIITFSKSYEGNGTIEVSDIYSQLSQRLNGTNLSFLANKKLPPKVGSIQVATVGWLPVVHKLANKIGLYQFLTTVLFLGFSALTVLLARRKRRMLIQLTSVFAISMLVSLLSVSIAKGYVVHQVAPAYQSAVQVAYDTVLHGFVTQTVTILALAAFVVIVAWISGPYKSASLLKGRILRLLTGRLHQSLFGDHENGFTRLLGAHKRFVQWVSVLVIAIIMLVVQLSPKLIALYGLLMLVVVLLIELLASPETSQKVSE